MVYMSLIDQVRLALACPPWLNTTLPFMAQWKPGSAARSDYLKDIHDGQALGILQQRYPDFFADPINQLFMISTDGFLCWGKKPAKAAIPELQKGSGQSMWPITVTMNNLPSWMRTKAGAVLLVGLADVQHFHELQPWLAPVVDELLLLWEGVDMKVVTNGTDTTATVQGMVQHTITDYPGGTKMQNR
jgi:hypothetical protein